jgi:cytochrome c556
MNKQVLTAGLALMLGAGYSFTASAQAKPETLVKQRQAAMTLQGKYFYPRLRPMAQGKIPYDANVAAHDAELLLALTKMPWDGFVPSTKDLKSAALPAIYTDTAKFKESADRLQSETAKLVTLTKSGDEAAVKAQVLVVDKACGGCHESFREKQ